MIMLNVKVFLGEVFSVSHDLEFGGNETLEIRKDSIEKGQNIVIVDDIIATGGTLATTCRLLSKFNANVVACMVVINLFEYSGWEQLPDSVKKISLMEVEGK